MTVTDRTHQCRVRTRHRRLFLLVCWAIIITFGLVGGGYLSGQTHVTSDAWVLLCNLLPGGMRTHGGIMVGLALVLLYGMPRHRLWSQIALVGTMFYSTLTVVLLVGQWAFGPVDWAAPWWYFMVAVLSGGIVYQSGGGPSLMCPECDEPKLLCRTCPSQGFCPIGREVRRAGQAGECG